MRFSKGAENGCVLKSCFHRPCQLTNAGGASRRSWKIKAILTAG